MATPKLSSFHLEANVVELYSLETIAQDFIDDIARSLDPGSLQAFRNRCDEFIQSGKLRELVEAFLQGMVLAGPNSDDSMVEARFSIIFALARFIPADKLLSVVPQITSCVLQLPYADSGEETRAAGLRMRLDVLRKLYCVVEPRSPARFELLMQMISFSMDNDLFGVLDGTAASDIEELCSLWSTGNTATEVEQKRKLYKAFSDLCTRKLVVNAASLAPEQVRSEELKQHRFLTKLMETYEAAPEILNSATSYAARAALIAIKYPLPGDTAVSNSLEELSLEGFKRGSVAVLAAEQNTRVDWSTLTAPPSAIAHFAAVKYLSSVSEHAELYKLLQIFATEGVKELLKLQQQSPQLMHGLKLDPEACLRNIRYLTLASLAANTETVPYSTIAEKLECNESEVEKWVIDAITRRVIDAKMDQSSQSIVINRGSQRLLNDKQWVEVRDKLAEWKKSVRVLLGTIKSVRQEHMSLHQQQQLMQAQAQQ